MPREQRRILGRHSSAVIESDSFYSKDMSIGPVNSLQKVICMVRDGSFCPDATRANYFPHAGAPVASTPAHVVMQPFTPAFLEKTQTGTPGMELPVVGFEKRPGPPAPDDVGAGMEQEVKTEDSWIVLPAGTDGLVIEISCDF